MNNNLPWLEDSIIYKVISGSHAYGLNTPESDIDYRGICIPPKEYYMSPFMNFDQYITNDPDETIFSFDKYVKLATENNPNILELLWIDNPDLIKKMTYPAEILRENRELFLSAKCKFTYSGYAFSQLKRIKNHKQWIDDPPNDISREEMGLDQNSAIFSNNMLQSMVDNFRGDTVGIIVEGLCGYYDALTNRDEVFKIVSDALQDISTKYFREFSLKYFSNQSKDIVRKDLRDTIQKELDYYLRKRTWKQYQSWKKNRNTVRAALEEKYGFDVKHGSHLVRLMIQAEDILLNGRLTVDVSDKTEVLDVKAGKWSFDELTEWATDQDDKLEQIYKKKTYVVPHKPDVKKIEKMSMEILDMWYS